MLRSCQENTYHKFFSNLANDLKIKIILELKKKECSVGEICGVLGLEQSKVSHALGSLKKCNIVKNNQEGKKRIYSLNEETIVPMLKLIDEHSKTQCKGCPYRE